MKVLTKEQVFSLRLNTYSNIWTTGFLELNLDESYDTPFGVLCCTPGTGWHLKGSSKHKTKKSHGVITTSTKYLLTDLLHDNNINYAFNCPILKKLHNKKTNGIIFKILGFPNNTKCWI